MNWRSYCRLYEGVIIKVVNVIPVDVNNTEPIHVTGGGSQVVACGPQVHLLIILKLYVYLLTPWRRVLLQKLTGSQLVKKFTTVYGTRRFITAFTSSRHLSLSYARSIQSMPPHPTSRTQFNISNTEFFIYLFYCLGRTKGSVQVRGTSLCFVTWYIFTVRSF